MKPGHLWMLAKWVAAMTVCIASGCAHRSLVDAMYVKWHEAAPFSYHKKSVGNTPTPMGSVYVLVRNANDRDLASASETLTRREYQGAASLPPPSEAELQSFLATSSGIVAGELIRRGNRDDLMPLLLEMGIDRIDALPLEYLLAIEYAGGDTRAGMKVLLDLADLAHDTRYEPVAAAICYRAFAGVVNPGVKASELSGSALAGYIARCRSWLASHHNDLQIREEYPSEMWTWAGGEPPKMLYATSGS